jgi:arginine utilization regulatory protein
LRVLEDGIIRRVGGSQNISVDVRIIAAMNVHPNTALQNQKLRSDLYYRLNVFTFSLLPLRDRKEDIQLLTHYFISFFNKSLQKRINGVEQKVKGLFMEHPWPGNVRELKHTIEYMMNVCDDEILQVRDLPIMMKQLAAGDENSDNNLSLRKNLEELEKKLIHTALELSAGNVKQAAELLDIPRQTLQYKIKKLRE